VLKHENTIEFAGHIYHLTLQLDHADDYVVPYYVLFGCDSAGVICETLYVQYRYPINTVAELIVADSSDALNLQIGGETVYTVHADEATGVEDKGA
jgi:hypothetical protein